VGRYAPQSIIEPANCRMLHLQRVYSKVSP
jgi:hypothetical protein